MYVVITGGPGAGKTTLVDALRERGYACVPEAARAIVRDQAAIGGTLHVGDSDGYAETIMTWDMRNHRDAATLPRPVFFDRGLPDRLGFPVARGEPVPPHVTAAAARFRYDLVFVAPPWAEIYARDAERTHTFAHALRVYDACVAGYRLAGYGPVELPKVSVDERVAFVLDRVNTVGPDR
jgi:predicted ATPase